MGSINPSIDLRRIGEVAVRQPGKSSGECAQARGQGRSVDGARADRQRSGSKRWYWLVVGGKPSAREPIS